MANLPDSTLDPAFFLHHGLVDFMFLFWQDGPLGKESDSAARGVLLCGRRGNITTTPHTPNARPVGPVPWLPQSLIICPVGMETCCQFVAEAMTG